MSWRLLAEDGVSDSRGLATDEWLTRRVGESGPTLRLYTYRSHCALTGRFQNVENEVRVEACAELGIPINRRPTGGGTILMGDDQLGVALVMPGRTDDPAGNRRGWMRERMAQFSGGLIHALDRLGIRAGFRGKNDLVVDGRKIAGLGVYREPGGGLLFHASLLVGFDADLMCRVLQTPLIGSEVAARIATVRRETGSSITVDEVRSIVADGFASTFDVRLDPGSYTDDEQSAITGLECEKYQSPEWVMQETPVRDADGAAIVATPAGTLDVQVSLAGRMIKSVAIRGSFFAGDGAVAGLEGRLRWHSSERHVVCATVSNAHASNVGSWGDVRPEVLQQAILEAIDAAADRPYGCFMNGNPEAAHGSHTHH